MLQDTLDTNVLAIPNIKGMPAGVYEPGQGIWQGTSGVSFSGCPLSEDMKFGIASNTKLSVATALLILAEDNLLSGVILVQGFCDMISETENISRAKIMRLK
jgi:CubicO group peptidase (beta-lactamase class C family)